MPVKIEIKMDVPSMEEFMLYHIYTSKAGIGLLVLGVLNVLFTVSFVIKRNFLYMLIFLMFSVLILVVFPQLIRSKVRKQMEGAEKLKEPVTYEFDDEGITTTTSDDSGKASWEKFKRAVSRKNILILYDSKKRAIILPVEQLGENYTAIVDMIYAHMPAPAVRIMRTDGKK